MSTLAKIRNRAGLLVAIIGVALFAFVLGDLFSSASFLSAPDNSVGEVSGKKISYDEFNFKVEQAIERHKKNSGENNVQQEVKDMLVKQTWDELVNELVMKKEFSKLGISVSDDELYDLMMGANPHPYIIQYFTDRQTGQIFEPYATPFGTLNVNKVSEYAQQMNPEQEASWVMLESAIKEARINEKYNNLIKKGIYVTASEAKRDYINSNKKINASYIVKRYSYLPDSLVSFTDSDLKKYYNDHKYEYKIKETTRKIEYVVFDAVPSSEDTAMLLEDLTTLAQDFKTTDPKDDSLFVVRESDSRYFNTQFQTRGALQPAEMDSIMFASETGSIYGPYIENNQFKISKLIAKKVAPDSVKARHILISFENTDTLTARNKADSIKKILNTKNFDELARKYSADRGSAEKGGDLGWFTEGQMVPSFNDACFNGKIGSMPVVESQFGIHLIEILDKTKEKEKIQVATIDRNILPGTKTTQTYYQQASQFAGTYNKADLFEKGVEEKGLTKRVADNLKEGDKNISGLESPGELVKWTYEAEIGDVSQAFDLNNKKYVVAHLVEIKEKGTAPFEQVKERVEAAVRIEKKAEQFIAEFDKVTATENNFENIAIKMNEQALDIENLNFSMYSVPGLGRENELIGAATTLKANEISKPIKGRNGVFLVKAKEVIEAPSITDYTASKNKILGDYSGKVDNGVFEALKENAGIENRLAKMF